MITKDELASPVKPTWCPGCGNFGIFLSLKNALTQLNVDIEDVAIVCGIGCHGHACSFLSGYVFEGLHGRPIPVAEGIKLANKKLKVIVIAGDGDTYGEGMAHFIAGVRGNHDVTLLVHDNRVYGLTTGQTSPTSAKGYKSKSTPSGVIEVPVNPVALAVTQGGGFVAQGFSADPQQLTDIIIKAIAHRGFSVVNILQNCATFNKVNTVTWFKEHTYKVETVKHNPSDKMAALALAFNTDKLPTGIIYQDAREAYDEDLPAEHDPPLAERDTSKRDLTATFKGFI